MKRHFFNELQEDVRLFNNMASTGTLWTRLFTYLRKIFLCIIDCLVCLIVLVVG